MLPFAPVASLLIELDHRTSFLDCFAHAGGHKQARSTETKRNILAVLIARATNLGLTHRWAYEFAPADSGCLVTELWEDHRAPRDMDIPGNHRHEGPGRAQPADNDRDPGAPCRSAGEDLTISSMADLWRLRPTCWAMAPIPD
jgi:Tn3 transposase DDE domain